MDPQNQSLLGEHGTQTDPPPSPRAFAIGTGVAFQTVGAILVFLAVMAWAVSGWTVPNARDPLANGTDFFRKENLHSALITILLLASLLGGMAMIAAGVGLQGERRSSGLVAMIVCGLLVTCSLVVATTYLVALNRIIMAMIVFALGIPAGVLFMLAGHSASILRKFPPPLDLNAATPELLDEFRQKRLERLKHYDS